MAGFEVRKDTERLIFQSTDSLAQKCEEWLRNDASPDSGTLANLMDWIERYTGGQICAAAHRAAGRTSQRESMLRSSLKCRRWFRWRPCISRLCLAPMTYLSREHGGLVQFACFDTAFHHTLDALETGFGLPAALTAQGLRRYGFHACLTNTSPACSRTTISVRHKGGQSLLIWAMAQVCAPCTTGSVAAQPWASLPWTAY